MDAREKARLIAKLVDDVADMIAESTSPYGVPGGHLYAGLMGVISIDNFYVLMDLVVRSGRVVKRGDCYVAVPKAQASAGGQL